MLRIIVSFLSLEADAASAVLRFDIDLLGLLGRVGENLLIGFVFNALRLRNIKFIEEGRTKMQQIYVTNMTCEHCVKRIKDVLISFNITDATFNLKTKEVAFTLGESNLDDIINKINEAGYEVSLEPVKKRLFRRR